MTKDTDAFDAAFVAVSYLLGRRDDLLAGLSNPGAAAARLSTALAAALRSERARALARGLRPIATELASRGVS